MSRASINRKRHAVFVLLPKEGCFYVVLTAAYICDVMPPGDENQSIDRSRKVELLIIVMIYDVVSGKKSELPDKLTAPYYWEEFSTRSTQLVVLLTRTPSTDSLTHSLGASIVLNDLF